MIFVRFCAVEWVLLLMRLVLVLKVDPWVLLLLLLRFVEDLLVQNLHWIFHALEKLGLSFFGNLVPFIDFLKVAKAN